MIGITSILGMFFGTSIKGYSIDKIGYFIKWLLIAIIVGFIAWFSYSHFSEYSDLLKTKVANEKIILDQKQNIKQLQITNYDLNEEIKLLRQSNKITEDSSSELQNKQLETVDTFTKNRDIRKKAEERVIKKAHEETSVSSNLSFEETDKRKMKLEDELSQIRINSIWKAYCSSNSPDPSTKDICSTITIT